MQANFNVPVPKLLNNPGLKPAHDLAKMWMAQGVVVTSSGYNLGGVTVRFCDLDNNYAVRDEAITESTGLFRALLPPNSAGYLAQPCGDVKQYQIYCPAHFYFKGNSPLMRFTAYAQPEDNKGQSK